MEHNAAVLSLHNASPIKSGSETSHGYGYRSYLQSTVRLLLCGKVRSCNPCTRAGRKTQKRLLKKQKAIVASGKGSAADYFDVYGPNVSHCNFFPPASLFISVDSFLPLQQALGCKQNEKQCVAKTVPPKLSAVTAEK